MISYPSKIPTDVVRDQAVTLADFYPTILDLCGLSMPESKLDGQNLMPIIKSAQAPTHYVAAYNAGENRIRKEIELQKTSDYFYLDLPMETERYVYKIAVAKIILSAPGKYGFSLEDSEFYDPLKLERVQIELKQPLPIIEVARAIGFYYKDLKEMNLHLPDEAIPTGIHFLNLPSGTSERFWSFLNSWKKETGKK